MKNVFRELFELTASELGAVAGGQRFHFYFALPKFALHQSALHEDVVAGNSMAMGFPTEFQRQWRQ